LSPLLISCSVLCQSSAISLPAGTPLPVQIQDHLPMRVGQPIRAQLIYPVYIDNTLVLPTKTMVTGSVTALNSNHTRRISARLRGDFTPFSTPIVASPASLSPTARPFPLPLAPPPTAPHLPPRRTPTPQRRLRPPAVGQRSPDLARQARHHHRPRQTLPLSSSSTISCLITPSASKKAPLGRSKHPSPSPFPRERLPPPSHRPPPQRMTPRIGSSRPTSANS
jgi:hypothetical protein